MDVERWQDIPEFNGLYQVSDQGRVRRQIRGGGFRVLAGSLSEKGYVRVALSGRPYRVHRLVMAAFVGTAAEKMTVNHKNGVKTDNRLVNLEYMTQKENVRHSMDVLGVVKGGRASGERNAHAKLTADKVRTIRERYAQGGISLNTLGREYGVSKVTIYHIVTCRIWKSVV